jgi:hypothetical protein
MLENLKPPTKSRPCKVTQVANQLSEQDRKIMIAAIDDAEKWPVKTLSKELRKLGIEISESPMYRHRGKSCGCA